MTRKTHYLRFTSRMILIAIKAGLAVALLAMVVTSRSAQAQTFTVLYTFENTPDGAYPVAPLVRDAEGTLYDHILRRHRYLRYGVQAGQRRQ